MKRPSLLTHCWIAGFLLFATDSFAESETAASAVVIEAGKPAGEERSDNELKMKLVWCPPGTFTMGLGDGQEHETEVILTKGLWLGKFEVTQREYLQLMGNNPSYFSMDGAGREKVSGRDTSRFPVEQVDWLEAMAFCRKLTMQERAARRLPDGWEYTLPTEAQWEYACRAGTTTRYSFGDQAKAEYANFGGGTDAADNIFVKGVAPFGTGALSQTTKRVGCYLPNPWGLYDMHGNVSEWCRDWHGKLPGGVDPEVTIADWSRIVRGGSMDCNSYQCETISRFASDPDDRNRFRGFRVALTPAVKASAGEGPPAFVVEVGAKAGEEQMRNNLRMKFVWCPPGKFTMGIGQSLRLEKPVAVQLTKGFWLGRFEVTQRDYEKIMGANPSFFSKEGVGNAEISDVDTSRLPVEQVSWKDATEFCRKLTERERYAGRLTRDWEYTLPTEAQWEYACRAGTTTRYSFGDQVTTRDANLSGVKNILNTGPDGIELNPVTTIVGSYRPNPWGLYDMHGNVSEWCRDGYARELPGGDDPEITTEDRWRIRRGGGFVCNLYQCDTTFRSAGLPDQGYQFLGFRVALTPSHGDVHFRSTGR